MLLEKKAMCLPPVTRAPGRGCGSRLSGAGRGFRTGGRRSAGIGLIIFFLAVAVAPHRHVNGLEDLLFDQPSDSGVVVVETPFLKLDPAGWNALTLVEDHPCLACFGSDFVSVPGQTLSSMPHLARISFQSSFEAKIEVPLLWRDAPSRAPPDSFS